MKNKITSQIKLRHNAILKGVSLIHPDTIFLSDDTNFGRNVVLEPFVVIGKKVSIGNNVKILSFSHIENTKIRNNITVGPFARLRPGTVLENYSKVGNFVEIKKSTIGKNSKVSHLSYIGDTSIGSNVNIGAGTITCNYDGRKKYKTKIDNNSFVGSNTSIVAPVKIGKNSMIGAGSVITKNVKSGTLALSRSVQKEIKKRKEKK